MGIPTSTVRAFAPPAESSPGNRTLISSAAGTRRSKCGNTGKSRFSGRRPATRRPSPACSPTAWMSSTTSSSKSHPAYSPSAVSSSPTSSKGPFPGLRIRTSRLSPRWFRANCTRWRAHGGGIQTDYDGFGMKFLDKERRGPRSCPPSGGFAHDSNLWPGGFGGSQICRF